MSDRSRDRYSRQGRVYDGRRDSDPHPTRDYGRETRESRDPRESRDSRERPQSGHWRPLDDRRASTGSNREAEGLRIRITNTRSRDPPLDSLYDDLPDPRRENLPRASKASGIHGDEGLRITVGNDQYQSHSRHSTDRDRTRESSYAHAEGSRERSLDRSSLRSKSPTMSAGPSSADIFPDLDIGVDLKRHKIDMASLDPIAASRSLEAEARKLIGTRMEPSRSDGRIGGSSVPPGRDLEKEFYKRLSPYRSKDSPPDNRSIASLERERGTSAPPPEVSIEKTLVPGVDLDAIEDEDAFLYGDSGSNVSSSISYKRPASPIHQTTGSKLTPTGVPPRKKGLFDDEEHLKQTPPLQTSIDLGLPGKSLSQGKVVFDYDNQSRPKSAVAEIHKSGLYGPEGSSAHSSAAPPPHSSSKALYTPASVQPSKSSDQADDSKEYDPTIENILKSIGFNFELSKQTQEKAKLEREMKAEVKPESYGVTESSSFLSPDGGLDMAALFQEKLKEAEERAVAGSKLKALRQQPESYEERARRYREELMKKALKQHEESPPPKQPAAEALIQSSLSMLQSEYADVPADKFTRERRRSRDDHDRHSRDDHDRHSRDSRPRDDHYEAKDRGQPVLPGYQDQESPPFNYQGLPPIAAPLNNAVSSVPTIDLSLPPISGPLRVERTRESVGGIDPDEEWERKRQEFLRKLQEPRPIGSESRSKGGDEGEKISKRTVLPPGESRRTISVAKKRSPPRRERSPEPKRERSLDTERRTLKVAESKEQLARDLEEKQKRLKALDRELERLRRQQGEMMRKKQRQKDPHKDPLLIENSKLQKDISEQIKVLRLSTDPKVSLTTVSTKDVERESKKSSLYDNVSSDSEFSDGSGEKDSKDRSRWRAVKSLKAKSVDRESRSSSRSRQLEEHMKDPVTTSDKADSKKTKAAVKDEKKTDKSKEDKKANVTQEEGKTDDKRHVKKMNVTYEYFDPGNHWCRHCNCVSSSLDELFDHLHSQRHLLKMDRYNRPWITERVTKESKNFSGKSISTEMKGVEFVMPAQAFFCNLCKVFLSDSQFAEDHLKSDDHNDKYCQYVEDNKFYERRLALDRAAGLAGIKEDRSSLVTESKPTPTPKNEGGNDDDYVPPTHASFGKKSPAVITASSVRESARNRRSAHRERLIETEKEEEIVTEPSPFIGPSPEPEDEKEKGKINIKLGKKLVTGSNALDVAAKKKLASFIGPRKQPVLFGKMRQGPKLEKKENPEIKSSDIGKPVFCEPSRKKPTTPELTPAKPVITAQTFSSNNPPPQPPGPPPPLDTPAPNDSSSPKVQAEDAPLGLKSIPLPTPLPDPAPSNSSPEKSDLSDPNQAAHAVPQNSESLPVSSTKGDDKTTLQVQDQAESKDKVVVNGSDDKGENTGTVGIEGDAKKSDRVEQVEPPLPTGVPGAIDVSSSTANGESEDEIGIDFMDMGSDFEILDECDAD